MKSISLVFMLICTSYVMAQFSPPAGQPGSVAIYKDDSRIKAWATEISVIRGPIHALDSSMGFASAGLPESAIGPAGTDGVVSLGDGGTATIRFNGKVYNDAGFDFVVFENSFSDDFLEFAFVEVSTDGEKFIQFPATSLLDTSIQTDPFGLSDCRKVNNLAGNFRALYGTPFDLDELKDSTGIDISDIRYIRIRDVIGSINPVISSRDSKRNKINDPFPTDFPSCGFDLDAVGAIHIQLNTAIFQPNKNSDIKLISNFISEDTPLQVLNSSSLFYSMNLVDVCGKIVQTFQVAPNQLQSISLQQIKGLYFLTTENAHFNFRIILQ